MFDWQPQLPFDVVLLHLQGDELDESQAETWLSEAERLRYRELLETSVAKRARQWLLGRRAAKLACRHWFERQQQTPPEWTAITIANDEWGAPRLEISGYQVPPSLSISHCDDESLAAVAAHGQHLGVDIERCGARRASALGLARRFCDEAEFQHWFDGLDEPGAQTRMLRLWVLKEAAAKATGRGFQGRPQTFTVEALRDDSAWVRHQGVRYEARLWADDERLMSLAWEG